MLAALAVMAIGGFVFNALAARSVSKDVLGIHASLLFWVLLINQVTSLGLPVTMSRLGRFPARATRSTAPSTSTATLPVSPAPAGGPLRLVSCPARAPT